MTSSNRNNRDLLSVLAALALAVLITISAVEIAGRMARKSLLEEADVQANLNTARVKTISGTLFTLTKWSINSFLVSIADVIEVVEDSDVHIITTQALAKLDTTYIRHITHSFLTYHYEFHSAIFIFEPGTLKEIPDKAWSTCAYPGDSRTYNIISDNYNPLDSRLYKSTAENGITHISSGRVSEDGSWVITFSVPFFDENGRLVGQFWVDSNPSYMSDVIEQYRSAQDDICLIINDDLEIISATDKSVNGMTLTEAMQESKVPLIEESFYDSIASWTANGSWGLFRQGSGKTAYCTYVVPVMASPYSLILIKPESKIYSTVAGFRWKLWGVIGISMLLTILCCYHVFMMLKKRVQAAQTIESELNTATLIQRRMLPDNPLEGQLPQGLDIYGFQRPAKSVGGDLFDYIIRNEHLYVCIGDVSGKGIPAAMVMTELCSLFRYIVHSSRTPAEIMWSMNRSVMEYSDDSAFCTMFIARIDLATGVMEYCNAGHNPPMIVSQTGQSRCMDIKPNMPLYAFEDWDYKDESMTLEPGDMLMLYTDGVTEARGHNGFLGSDAVLRTLSTSAGCKPIETVDKVLRQVEKFTENTEQNDDITILAVRWDGPVDSKVHLHYDAVKEHVTEIVDAVLNAAGRQDDLRLRLAIEEPVQNVADYAYTEDGPLDISVDCSDGNSTAVIELTDHGVPFNPLENTAPDLSTSLADRQAGGLGIHFTKQIMADLGYTYSDGHNILKLTYKAK